MILTRTLDTGALDIPVKGPLSPLYLRPLEQSDADALAAAYLRNREHLAPWEPIRDDGFFTEAGQDAVIRNKLELSTAGSEVPWVVVAGHGTPAQDIVGMITLTGIVRGPFLSANLGYWIDQAYTGRGAASGAVAAVVNMAKDDLGLHRIQAATLLHNGPSQSVLKGSGFERIGMAPKYLRIAGVWQDHLLYQRLLF